MDQLVAPALPAADQEALLLAVADGRYLVAAGDGVVRECGDELAARVGSSAASAVGRPLTELLGAADPQTMATAFAAALAGPGRELTVNSSRGGSPLRLCVVPVPLALGWEFTALLGDIGIRDPGAWTVGSLRAQHGPALDALAAAPGDPAGRLAGILVVARPGPEERLDREDIARRRAERAAAAGVRAAENAAGIVRTAPRAPDGDGPDALDGLVDGARELRRRLDEAEEVLRATAAERDATAAERDATAAERDATAAERDELHERLEQERLARAEQGAAVGEAEAARDELAEQLEQLRDGADTATRLVAELDGARAELAGARTQLEDVTGALEEAQAQLELVREERDRARADRAEALERADLLAAEAGRVLTVATTIRTELALDAEPAQEHGAEERPALPVAEHHAFALVGPGGCFTRLDESFCGLLGYREDELRQAGWPSIIDSDHAAAHRELARRLRAGELDEAAIETFYMHACGLLVGIAARVTAAAPAGHLLLEVDLERIAGPVAHRP